MENENASRYKDRPKNPRREVQIALKHKRVFGVQRAIWHFKRARFSPCGL